MERIPHQILLKSMGKSKNAEFKRLKEENAELKKRLDMMGKSTSDLKAKFIGEHSFETEQFDADECEYMQEHIVPWTLQKQIFKEMCEYVKNRKEGDIRP